MKPKLNIQSKPIVRIMGTYLYFLKTFTYYIYKISKRIELFNQYLWINGYIDIDNEWLLEVCEYKWKTIWMLIAVDV